MSGQGGGGDGRAGDLARLTLELCSIPSETGNEREIANVVEAFCLEHGGSRSVRRLGNNLVCDPAPDRRGHTVALVGHLDTVRCAEDQPVEIRDGRVYGCGASDMKGGVAVMMTLLRAWRSMAVRPVFVFYDREEGPNDENGLEPVLEARLLPRPDLAVILEPTDDEVQLGCMGLVHATVTVRGARAHSARPWQGRNALYEAIPLLEKLRDFGRREVSFGDLVFYEVVNATQAWTENSRNVIPDRADLNVNFRFAPGRSVEEAEAELRRLVEPFGEVEVIDRGEAGVVVDDHPLLDPWIQRRALKRAPKQAWTDVARLTGRGIPAVNFGPGDAGQAHQAGEWCRIDRLVSCYEALEELLTTATGEASRS